MWRARVIVGLLGRLIVGIASILARMLVLILLLAAVVRLAGWLAGDNSGLKAAIIIGLILAAAVVYNFGPRLRGHAG